MLVSFVLNLGAELVGKKWRAVIIWHLKDGPLRFSQLKRLLPNISVKVLTEVLKEMEVNGLIVRTQFATIPVKVTYEIHPDAMDFVAANVVCTIKIAQYVAKNHTRYKISEQDLKELTAWIKDHVEKINILIAPLTPEVKKLPAAPVPKKLPPHLSILIFGLLVDTFPFCI